MLKSGEIDLAEFSAGPLPDANPVVLPFKEVMAALEKGDLDCAERNMPSL